MLVSVPTTDGAHLETLFRAHATAMLRLATVLTGDRSAAEELVQDAFVALVRQPHLPQTGTELAYLRRTILNLSNSRHRHMAVVRSHPQLAPGVHPAAEDGAERRHVQARVVEAVRSLPGRQRDCMVLRCYTEASDREIADALGISVGSVKTHLHRARATLAPLLEDLR